MPTFFVDGVLHGPEVMNGSARGTALTMFAVAVPTLALGTAIGLAVPQTRKENELFGQARDTLIERAQGMAQETIEKVQEVATEAGHTVQREAKSAGLTQ